MNFPPVLPDTTTVLPRPRPAVNAPRMVNFTGVPEGMAGNQYYGSGISGIEDSRQKLAAAAGGGLENVREPFGGAAYVINQLGNAMREHQALSAERATRDTLASIMGGVDPTKGPTAQDVQAAMEADPAYGQKLYEQMISLANQEHWEPVPGQPGIQRNTRTGETKASGDPTIGGKPSDINSMRGQLQQTSAYKNLADAHSIWVNLVDTEGRDTGASDLNFIYGIAKIFDPTSVVRDGELQMAKSTADVLSMFRGLYRSAAEGKSAMSPEVRANLINEARSRMKAYRESYKMAADFYTQAATLQGFDPKLIVQDFPDYGEAPDDPNKKPPPKEDPANPDPNNPPPPADPAATDPYVAQPQGDTGWWPSEEQWKGMDPADRKTFIDIAARAAKAPAK